MAVDSLLPHCTVRLVGLINNSVVSTGTGFYYFFNDTFTDQNGDLQDGGTARIGIVTNKHVIENIEDMVYYFNSSVEGESGYISEEVRVPLNGNTVIPHPDPNIDLCVILADSLIDRIRSSGRKLHLYPVRNSIRINEEDIRNMDTIQNLLMIGYPDGIWDSVNNLPIMRKGINATPLYESYQGREAFAVDIATYRGSSGSPVFIYDNGAYIESGEVKFGSRLFFVGIIEQAHRKPTRISQEMEVEEMLHIGIAIKAKELDVFEELVRLHYEG